MRNPYGIVPQEIFHAGLSPTTIAAFTALTTFANAQRVARPPLKLLAQMLNLSERSTREHIKALEDKGFIVTIPRYTDSGRQLPNFYRLTLNPASSQDAAEFTPEGEARRTQEGEARRTRTLQGRTLPEEQNQPTLSLETTTESDSPISEKSAAQKSVWDESSLRCWQEFQPYERPKGSKQLFLKEWDKRVWRKGNDPVDPEMVIRAMKTYCQRCHRTRTLTMDLVRWIRNELWTDELEPDADVTPNRYESPHEREKRLRVEGYHARGFWLDEWGPKPQSRPGSAVRSAALEGAKR